MTFTLPKSAASQDFCPVRFRAARLRRGLSVGRLAELIGVERHAVSRYEAGQFAPTKEHLNLAARALGFPPAFFLGKDIGDLSSEAISFRCGYALPATTRAIASGSAMIAAAFHQQASGLLSLLNVQLPNLVNKSPTRAADLLRGRWDLGPMPVPRLLPLLEERGVCVFSLPSDCAAADSFSFRLAGHSFIMLNTSKSRGEQRVDLAHELGHILLHPNGAVGDAACREAADFADAFLMPADQMKALKPAPESIEQLHKAASDWGVSELALARRLHALGMLTERKFRRLRLEVARTETDASSENMTSETSGLLTSIFATLRARRITKQKLATTFSIYPRDIDALTFGLSDLVTEGAIDAPTSVTPLRPKLQVVRTTD